MKDIIYARIKNIVLTYTCMLYTYICICIITHPRCLARHRSYVLCNRNALIHLFLLLLHVKILKTINMSLMFVYWIKWLRYCNNWSSYWPYLIIQPTLAPLFSLLTTQHNGNDKKLSMNLHVSWHYPFLLLQLLVHRISDRNL